MSQQWPKHILRKISLRIKIKSRFRRQNRRISEILIFKNLQSSGGPMAETVEDGRKMQETHFLRNQFVYKNVPGDFFIFLVVSPGQRRKRK